MTTFVPNRDLCVTFILVDVQDLRTPQPGKRPIVKVRINGQPFRRIGFPIIDAGYGWYETVIPAKYVGGVSDIIVTASADGTAEWRQIISEHKFATEGGNVFEPEPLPVLREPSTGPELLDDSWVWHDQRTDGRIREKGADKVSVTLGNNTQKVMQLMQTLPIEAGRYRITAKYVGPADVATLSLVQHDVPYANLGDEQEFHLSLSPDAGIVTADVILKAEPQARFRVLLPRGTEPRSRHTFSELSLRKTA